MTNWIKNLFKVVEPKVELKVEAGNSMDHTTGVLVPVSNALPAIISVLDVRNDPPEFKREYKARLTDQVSLKVTLRSVCGGGRYDMSELVQPNGKWVLFDLRAPADKILDRELLPLVRQHCDQIIAMDRAYVASTPHTFTDTRGHVWTRDMRTIECGDHR